MGKLFTLFLVTSLAFAGKPTHLELELSALELQNLLQKQRRWSPVEHALDPVIASGKRFLDWLVFINDHREPAKKISLSSPATQPGFPIESPRLSNPKMILESFEAFKKASPPWLNQVVFEGHELTENPPISDEEFRNWGLKLEPIYARASRWLLQEPQLKEYAEMQKYDVRGYYFLGKNENLKTQLEGWKSLSEPEKATFSILLVGLCFNKEKASKASCQRKFNRAVSRNEVFAFYEEHRASGERLWNEYFEIPVVRTDVKFNSDILTTASFVDPGSADVRSFLKDNIEEEWKWNGWQLRLDFLGSGPHPKIVFVPGATANVNQLAGDTITMDANKPITEYEVQWTIRHEYGHVLGFPDCYVEFYDESIQTMVSYQLDITNLMCSRRGHLKEIHYQQMLKAYKSTGTL